MLRDDGNENSKKISRSNQQKNNFARAAHFFLHDYNVKLPETSQLHVLRRKRCMCSCSPFSLPLNNFHLGGCQYFSFSYRCYKIFMFLCNEIDILCFYLSFQLFLRYPSQYRRQNQSTERIELFLISKRPGGYAIYRRNARVLEKQNFTLACLKGWMYVGTHK